MLARSMAAGTSLALRVEVLAIGPLWHALMARSAMSAAAALRRWVVHGVELGAGPWARRRGGCGCQLVVRVERRAVEV